MRSSLPSTNTSSTPRCARTGTTTNSANYIKKQSIDEMKHAEALIERILFLDGIPNMTEALESTSAATSKSRRKRSQARSRCCGHVQQGREVAREEGDNASRELFERLLKDEEEHVDWLEAQMHQINEMGYERYLSQQIRDEK